LTESLWRRYPLGNRKDTDRLRLVAPTVKNGGDNNIAIPRERVRYPVRWRAGHSLVDKLTTDFFHDLKVGGSLKTYAALV
jgi:hypothetical protein